LFTNARVELLRSPLAMARRCPRTPWTFGSAPPRGSEAGARRRWDEEEQGGEVSRADHNARERAPLWRRPRAGEGRARGGERERRGPEWVVEGHGRKEDSIGLHKKTRVRAVSEGDACWGRVFYD